MTHMPVSARSFAILAVVSLGLLSPRPAWGDTITYRVTADTSGIAGAEGFLEFQFNPASSLSLLGAATLADFQTDGTLTSAYPNIGDAAGTLPGPLSFDNATPLNDIYRGFTYGMTVSFLVSFSGPAVGQTPPGTQFGSTFAVFFEDAASNPLSLSPSGDAADFAINPDGTIAATSYPPINPDGPAVIIQSIPEPSSALLTAVGITGWLVQVRNRRRIKRGHGTQGSSTQ